MSHDASPSSRSLVFIRHGQSTWNLAGRWQGQADPPLSPEGERQAERLGAALAGRGITLLACSDLRRARDTADVLARALGLTPRVVPGLRELDAGCWSGLTRAEVRAAHGADLARFEAGDLSLVVGGGESRDALRERMRQALRDLVAEAGSGTLAVVAHLGGLRSLAPGVDLANGAWIELDLACLDAAADEAADPGVDPVAPL